MSEILKEVLLIDSNGMETKCVVIENLPYNLVYKKVKKMMPIEEYSDKMVAAFVVDENSGRRIPTGEMVDELLPGITLDGAGSGGLVFDRFSDDSIQRLKSIVEHVDDTIKDPALRIRWDYYASQPKNKSASPRPIHTIYRVRLPIPASPSAVLPTAAPVTANTASVAVTKAKRTMSAEHKAKLKESLARAREAKKKQETN